LEPLSAFSGFLIDIVLERDTLRLVLFIRHELRRDEHLLQIFHLILENFEVSPKVFDVIERVLAGLALS
jgi:hypothetical protein